MQENAAVLGTYIGLKVTSGTRNGTTAVLNFSQEIAVSFSGIDPTLHSKDSDNSSVSADPLYLFKISNALSDGFITAQNLDKTYNDSKFEPYSSSPQTNEANVYPCATTASA